MEQFIVKMVGTQPVLFEEIKEEEPSFFEYEDKKFSTKYVQLGSIVPDSEYSLAERYSVRDIIKVDQTESKGPMEKKIITALYRIEKKREK